MKIPGPVYVCGLGRKLFVLGRMLWGWGVELSWGLFSNFFCTFGSDNKCAPFILLAFSPHGMENQVSKLLNISSVDPYCSVLVAKAGILTHTCNPNTIRSSLAV